MNARTDLIEIIDETLFGAHVAIVALREGRIELARRQARIDALEAVLRQIVHEYDQTFDADCDGGIWTSAASIPAEVMDRAQALLR